MPRIRLLLLVGLLLAIVPTGAAAASQLRVVAPNQPARGSFSVSADGRTIAYAEIPNCGRGLCGRYPTFVARDGQGTLRIDDARFRPLTSGGVALSGDGRVAAYPASDQGRPGTVLYDLAQRRSRFVAGFVVAPKSAPYHALSGTGRFLLGFRGSSSSAPGVYDTRTGAVVPLPKPPRPFKVAVPEFLSSDGRSVLLTDSTAANGGMTETVLLSTTTRRSTPITWSDRSHHAEAVGLGLSVDGTVALVAGAPRSSSSITQATLFDGPDNRSQPLFTDPSSFLFGAAWSSVSLSGNGRTMAFACHDSLYLYDLAASEISVVVEGFYHGHGSVTGTLTSDGTAIVFESGALPGSPLAHQRGLFEMPTANARAIGTAFPGTCRTAE